MTLLVAEAKDLLALTLATEEALEAELVMTFCAEEIEEDAVE